LKNSIANVEKACFNSTKPGEASTEHHDMNDTRPPGQAQISVRTARVAIGAAGVTLLLLASLHVLSPEFDPSFRVVSEYANGRYAWVLSLMFTAWAVSSWSLVIALWSQLAGIRGKIALGFLIAAGVGEAMAAFCDINHPLHNLAGAIGVLSLPIAAVWISILLAGTPACTGNRRLVLIVANLPWMALVLMGTALFALVKGYRIAPPGMEVIGWTNRLLVVAYCAWVMTIAWQGLRCRGPR
jgi:hypothetical protein